MNYGPSCRLGGGCPEPQPITLPPHHVPGGSLNRLEGGVTSLDWELCVRRDEVWDSEGMLTGKCR